MSRIVCEFYKWKPSTIIYLCRKHEADLLYCLRLGKDGESTFVALKFYYAKTILKEFAEYKKDTEYLNYLEESQKKLEKLIQDLCWNEDRFIRGFTEDGEVIGQRTDPEANSFKIVIA